MATDRREQRRAAVRAARDAREHLAGAAHAIRSGGAPEADDLEAELTTVVRRLFAAETASPEDLVGVLRRAMDELGRVLVALHGVTERGGLVTSVTESVARTLAVLYPARKDLERALAPEEAPAIPLTRRPDGRDDAPAEERRTAPRVAVETDIGFHSETNFYTGFSGDLSDGGLFVATYDLLPVGTELTVSFVLPEGHQVTARGHVSWLREALDHDGDLHPGMGVAFDDLSMPDHDAVMRFLRRRAPLFYSR